MANRYETRLPTGIPGLDEVLCGGLPEHGMYLLQGEPGVGKTTFGLQFLLEGARHGEAVLYVSFAEGRAELQAVARAHGWDLDAIQLHVAGDDEAAGQGIAQTMYHPSEVELEETMRPLLDRFEHLRPRRVVLDSVSQIRLMSRDAMGYRRHLLTLKQLFADRGCSTVLIDDTVPVGSYDVVKTVVHGIITLEKHTPVYGTTRRRLAVDKLRGVAYTEGYHDYRVRKGGLEVFPRLVAAQHLKVNPTSEQLSSGVPKLDALVGGGLERGTSTLIMGAAGTGKSSLAAQYVIASARKGEKAAVFAFEESMATWIARTRALGFDPEPLVANGMITLRAIDPAELTPGELSATVVQLVQSGCKLLVIDSLNGYLQSVPEDNFLVLHLHELLSYFGHADVTTLLVMAQVGLVGPGMQSPVDISYLADSVIVLRYFEACGVVRKAISVLKKRRGGHERTLREYHLGPGGIELGEPLSEFHGVLTGVPALVGPGSQTHSR